MVCARLARGIATEKMVCPWLAPTGYGFWAKVYFVEVVVLIFVFEEVPVLGLLVTLIFLVFEEELEGVLRMIIVDLVPMPVCKCTWLPRLSVLRYI